MDYKSLRKVTFKHIEKLADVFGEEDFTALEASKNISSITPSGVRSFLESLSKKKYVSKHIAKYGGSVTFSIPRGWFVEYSKTNPVTSPNDVTAIIIKATPRLEALKKFLLERFDDWASAVLEEAAEEVVLAMTKK